MLPAPDPIFYYLVDWWHDHTCGSNHTDMCGYFYHILPNNRGMRWTKHNHYYANSVYNWLNRPDWEGDTYKERAIKNAYRNGTLTREML